MVDWRDARQRQAALMPTAQCPEDNAIHCYLADGSLYVGVSRSQWKRLREKCELESYLDKRRKSGAVITRDHCRDGQ